MASAKYWVGILYPENMVDDWQDRIGDLLDGIPYCYCIHDKDTIGYDPKTGEEYMRKVHVHLIVCFSNTTTQNFAKTTMEKLSKPGHKCLGLLPQAISKIRGKYDYLIHDTESSRKLGKYLYDKSERKEGNNFDIGAFEQISLEEKSEMAKELCDLICKENILNFTDFYMFVTSNYDFKYFDVIKGYSGLFERLCKGNYQKYSSRTKNI